MNVFSRTRRFAHTRLKQGACATLDPNCCHSFLKKVLIMFFRWSQKCVFRWLSSSLPIISEDRIEFPMKTRESGDRNPWNGRSDLFTTWLSWMRRPPVVDRVKKNDKGILYILKLLLKTKKYYNINIFLYLFLKFFVCFNFKQIIYIFWVNKT